MAEESVSEIPVHAFNLEEEFNPLPQPIATSFGEFALAADVHTGCVPLDVLEGNGVLMFSTGTEGSPMTRKITIGKTPDDLDFEDESLAHAGKAGEFLMHVQYAKEDHSQQGSPRREGEEFLFLDREDLKGSKLLEGTDGIKFGINSARGRSLGVIRNVNDIFVLK